MTDDLTARLDALEVEQKQRQARPGMQVIGLDYGKMEAALAEAISLAHQAVAERDEARERFEVRNSALLAEYGQEWAKTEQALYFWKKEVEINEEATTAQRERAERAEARYNALAEPAQRLVGRWGFEEYEDWKALRAALSQPEERG